MFSSVKSQSRYKRSAYVSLSSSFSTCPFQSTSFSMRYTDATTRSASQSLACTQVTPLVHYELALTNATHHTCNVSLLQASVKPCSDLPKQSTFPLLLLCLLYSNSSPHYNTFHTHKHYLVAPTMDQRATTTDYYLNGRETKCKHKITAPQATATYLDSRRCSVARS